MTAELPLKNIRWSYAFAFFVLPGVLVGLEESGLHGGLLYGGWMVVAVLWLSVWWWALDAYFDGEGWAAVFGGAVVGIHAGLLLMAVFLLVSVASDVLVGAVGVLGVVVLGVGGTGLLVAYWGAK